MPKDRIDNILVAKKIANNIQEAQSLVYAGKIHTKDKKIEKPSEILDTKTPIFCKQKKSKFVSRAGDKLFNCLKKLNLVDYIKNKTIIDVGASTGGFTDCLLQLGAKKIIALDVGTNQLSWKLRQNPKVISLEKTDIRSFNASEFSEIEFLVADISFNSVAYLSKYLVKAFNTKPFEALILVKPQFELPRSEIPEGGVITDKKKRTKAIESVIEKFKSLNIECVKPIDSDVLGKNGNIETFLYLKKT